MKQSQKMPSRPQYSRDTQVLRSIEAHSAISVQQSEIENLMSRLLLLSIQIDRKDHIIFELLQLTSKEESQRSKQSLQKKCSAYQLEIKNLNDIVAMLKQNISSFEISKQREMFASVNNQFSQELESKVSQLQKQLRRTMEQKIDLQEQLKQIRLNQTLAEFNSFKNQHNQKGRVRELQTMLSTERARAQNDKKALFQKGQLIEELKKRVLEFQSREKMIVGQYEQKLRAYHSELIYTQNLKKSQIMTTQQRINVQAQQIANLQEDNRAFKIANDQLKQALSKKQNQVSKLYNDYRTLESKMLRLQSQNKQISYKLQIKVEELRVKDQEILETKIKLQKLSSEIEEFRFNYATTGQEIQLYVNQNTRIKTQSSRLESKVQEQRQQIRKLKRKPMSQDILCEGCKVRQSSSLIASQKSIKFFNISEIIEQTQQLFKSNRKIEQLINKVQLSSEPSSIQMYQSRTVDM